VGAARLNQPSEVERVSQRIFITFDDAVREFGLEPLQVQKWMNSGQLKAYNFHDTMNFKRGDLERLRGGGGASPLASGLEEFFPESANPLPGAEQVIKLRVSSDQASDPVPTGPPQAPGNPATPPNTRIADPEEDERTAPRGSVLGQKPDEDDEETFLEPLLGTAQVQAPGPPPPAPADSEKSDLIRFHCVCGKRLKSDRKYIGTQVLCPRCGQEQEVPGENQPRQSPGIPPEIERHLSYLKSQQRGIGKELRRLSDRLDRVGSGPPGDESPPVSGAEGTDARPLMAELDHRANALGKRIDEVSAQVAELLRQNEETRFDVARLYDLLSRLSPGTSVPAQPIRDVTEESGSGDD